MVGRGVQETVVETAGPRPRRDKGTTRIGTRDLAALRWVGEQYAARADQLARLLRGGERPLSEGATRAVLRRWERLGVATHERILAQEPGWVWLTNRGLRAVALPWKGWTPSPGALEHVFRVNEIRMYIQRRDPARAWTGERQLRFEAPSEEHRRQVPDGVVDLPDGARIAVEVELTVKAINRYPEIIDRLLRAYPAVWYFCRAQAAPPVERCLAEFPEPARSRVRVYRLEDLP